MSQPNKTLYINNINDKIKKPELRHQLYQLFSPYGRIIDITALKTSKTRGQAFVAFVDQVAATTALRSLGGETFYGKPLKIAYAKSVSNALLPPSDSTAPPASKVVISNAQREADDLKRAREEEDTIAERKRSKPDPDAEEDGDMAVDDGDEPGPRPS
ncbi:Spliceosomal protein snRNP-U1A/U2B [Phaffia rhodozyma]|uniref:Spliceosomal protein snRNP-U1A/U2B n=1 Tax=Phaffia rhodozyma TaxID=264483 RepID=A0A0F7SHU6_PHARH|nr:Spliceosomal protein snRNP-U1A/U2B [Phaffia rhodozyma]